MKNIQPELQSEGFEIGQRIASDGDRYVVTPAGGRVVSPPLVYVIVDSNGEPVKTGRSLRQNINERHGSLAAAMNGGTTPSQNNKPVVVNLRAETDAAGPLCVYVRHCATAPAACAEDLKLFDRWRGRIDRRRG